MNKSAQYRRLTCLGVLLAVALASLGCRLVDLQARRHDELSGVAQRITQDIVQRQPIRGQIKDARGNILATSLPAKTIVADPALMGEHFIEIARALAPILMTNETFLIDRLRPTRMVEGKTVTNRFSVLRKQASIETWQQVQATMAALSFGVDETRLPRAQRRFYGTLRTQSVRATEDQRRDYPNHSLAAHVVGFVTGDEPVTGGAGVEASFNSKLSGTPGWRRSEKNSHSQELLAFREQDVEARDGLNVVLTLDAGLQYIVEVELAEAMRKHTPLSACATVIRPKTGEILAMATLPNFDPSSISTANPDSLRNRVIGQMIEPGSTFKTVVVSAALNDSVVRLTDEFFCEHGNYQFGGVPLHDHESYGRLSVENIVSKSSNIGAAKIGIQLGQTRLYDYIRAFGFGHPTGLPLPGEERGIVHPLANWRKYSIAQIPMGQGIAVTQLQMLMAVCAIANEGRLMRPMLIDRLEDQEGAVVASCRPQQVRQVISPAAASQMIQALKTVVSSDGTAIKAKLENYTVAGKTGTAQKLDPNGKYSKTRFVASFIGFFPADNPEICISVVMDEPKNGHQGGQCSAPVFRNMAERAAHYLNIRPDRTTDDPKSTLAAAKILNVTP